MSEISVRTLEERDIDFAYKMVSIEQWNDKKEHIRWMRTYEPKGCFIAEMNGEPAGHVFSVNYGKLGWIGLLIVKAEFRGKGVGTLLMKTAMDYLLFCKVETIKLEAVPEVANLYRTMGFVDEYDSLRFAGTTRDAIVQHAESVLPMQEDRIAEVARFDRKYFGADRTKVLNRLFQEYPKHCFVSEFRKEINGYIMCRKAETGYKLGPWVCSPETPESARKLLTNCISTIESNGKIYVGVPALNTVAIDVLRRCGFEQYSKSIRMRFGKKLSDCVNGVFAIGGPMKG